MNTLISGTSGCVTHIRRSWHAYVTKRAPDISMENMLTQSPNRDATIPLKPASRADENLHPVKTLNDHTTFFGEGLIKNVIMWLQAKRGQAERSTHLGGGGGGVIVARKYENWYPKMQLANLVTQCQQERFNWCTSVKHLASGSSSSPQSHDSTRGSGREPVPRTLVGTGWKFPSPAGTILTVTCQTLTCSTGCTLTHS